MPEGYLKVWKPTDVLKFALRLGISARHDYRTNIGTEGRFVFSWGASGLKESVSTFEALAWLRGWESCQKHMKGELHD
jgi:hypothetical protein